MMSVHMVVGPRRRVISHRAIWTTLRKILEFGYAPDVVFEDWLDLILAAHLSVTDNLVRKGLHTDDRDGPYEERYARILARYIEPRARDAFERAYRNLVVVAQASETDALDALHDLAFPYRTSKSASQTGRRYPWRVTSDACGTPIRFTQYACGSGRLLIALGRRHTRVELHAVETNEVCAKMCAVNITLFELTGMVRYASINLTSPSRCWRIFKGFIAEVGSASQDFVRSDSIAVSMRGAG